MTDTNSIDQKKRQDHVPTVSIGLPVYNGENYLRQAIDSLLAQTFTDFELIISDNASTDGTSKIIEQYAARDPRIKFFQQTANIGATKNFQFTFDQSHGTFFMWAAHDDLWDERWLEILVNEIRDADICVRGAVQILEATEIIACAYPHDFYKGQWLRLFIEPEVYYYKNCYIYSLFWRSKLNALTSSLHGGVVDEFFLLYEGIWQGNLRTIKSTYAICRIHEQSTGAQLSKAWKFSLLRATVQVHKLAWYRALYLLTPPPLKAAFLAAVPLKHAYAQFHLWFRAFRRLVLKRKNIHGLGKKFDQTNVGSGQ